VTGNDDGKKDDGGPAATPDDLRELSDRADEKSNLIFRDGEIVLLAPRVPWQFDSELGDLSA